MSFLITSPEKPDWQWNADEIEKSIRIRWAAVNHRRVVNPTYEHEWTVTLDDEEIVIELDKDGEMIAIDASIIMAAETAILVRRLTSPERPLVMFDEDYADQVDLLPDTTTADILAVFNPM